MRPSRLPGARAERALITVTEVLTSRVDELEQHIDELNAQVESLQWENSALYRQVREAKATNDIAPLDIIFTPTHLEFDPETEEMLDA